MYLCALNFFQIDVCVCAPSDQACVFGWAVWDWDHYLDM